MIMSFQKSDPVKNSPDPQHCYIFTFIARNINFLLHGEVTINFPVNLKAIKC
jgi:hypothetical protein